MSKRIDEPPTFLLHLLLPQRQVPKYSTFYSLRTQPSTYSDSSINYKHPSLSALSRHSRDFWRNGSPPAVLRKKPYNRPRLMVCTANGEQFRCILRSMQTGRLYMYTRRTLGSDVMMKGCSIASLGMA